jgi:hypothetical protein
MTHFLSKAHHLPQHRRRFAWAAMRFCCGLGTEWVVDEQGMRHTLACLLARVAGRSPLEYLDDAARARQQRVVLELMRDFPDQMYDLVFGFVSMLDEN